MGPHTRAIAAIALLSVGLSFRPARAGEEVRPVPRARSVLFYLMDTCRQDRLSFDGYERRTTPFLEWLAERSVVFEACYSQAPWTKPSMASMLSSQYPSMTGIFKMDQRLDAEVLTWPEVLQANGIYTAGFSANIVMGNTLSNFAQGFDHFVESTLINRADPIRFASGSARTLNEHAFPWLDSSDHWPMLLYLHSVDPHEEYEPQPAYLSQFADPQRHPQFREEWQKLLKSRPPIPGLYVTQDNFDRTDIDSASFIEHSSNLYDADILANDDQMQSLWDKLQDDGWADDFIFVFTSDHGEEFFDHGGTSHGYSLYDEMIRVPLMIYAPGLLPAGKKIDSPVRSLDIYPTLCDLLDFDIPKGLEGASLVPLIHGRDDSDPREVFSEHREDPFLRSIGLGSGVLVSLRSGRWKFILNEVSSQLLERPRYELYDLEQDPGEQDNVAEVHTDVLKRLMAQVVTFIDNHQQGASEQGRPTVDPEVLDQLRALGYVGEQQDKPDLWEAMATGHPEPVRRRLAAGADTGQLHETFGVRPLSMAAMTGNVEIAKLLLEAGAGVDARNQDESTALHGAAFFGRVELLELLLRAGADPDAKNARDDTVLNVSMAPWEITEFIGAMLQISMDRAEIEAGRLQCAESLLARTSTNDPTVRLFEAIRAGSVKAVLGALAEDASLKDWDSGTGWTPLFTAVFLGHEDIVRLLLESGAVVHAQNKDMGFPLHGAAMMGHVSVAELLREYGADIDARDGGGSTPLHAATFLGRVEAVQWLIREFADTNLKNNDGQTALDVTQADWQVTEYVIKILGLDLERTEVERNRAKVATLLRVGG